MEDEQLLITKLIGYCITDGCVTTDPETDKFNRIIFTNKSKALLEDFTNVMLMLGYSPRKGRCSRAEQVTVRSTELAEKLLQLTPTYRTKPCKHKPVCAKTKNPERTGACIHCEPLLFNNKQFPPAKIPVQIMGTQERLMQFLRIAASCDGGVRFSANELKPLRLRRQVFLSSSHPTIRDQYAQLLTLLGIPTRVEVPTVVIRSESDLRTYASKVGFVDGCKATRGKWRGLDKNTILSLAIQSYQDSQTIWGNALSDKYRRA